MPSYNSKKTAKEGDWNSLSLFFGHRREIPTFHHSKHIISPATLSDVFLATLHKKRSVKPHSNVFNVEYNFHIAWKGVEAHFCMLQRQLEWLSMFLVSGCCTTN